MAYNDYVILVDENGQPYIAHGERYQRFRAGLKNRAHKYLEKFPNLYRTGATAYAYTEDQLRQMRNYARTGGRKVKSAAKKAARYIDDHDAGITERIQARALEGKAKRVGKKDRDAGNELAVEAARLRRQAKSEYESSGAKKAADTVKKYGTTSLNAVKNASKKAARYIDDHDAGITERIQARALEGKAKRVGKKDRDAGNELAVEAARLRRQAKSEYESSGAKKVADKVHAAGNKASTAVKGAGTKAGGSVKNAVNKARNTISDVIDRKVTGNSASQNLSAATQNALMGLDGAMGDFADAQQAYQSSLNGGTVSARRRAAEALQDAKDRIDSLLKKAGGVFTKEENEIIQQAVNIGMDADFAEYIYHTKK